MSGLWMFYTDALDEDVERACLAAQDELRRRGFTAEEAQNAALAAADLEEDRQEDFTPDADKVIAWFAAEDAASKRLFELTGEWPHSAALVWTQEDQHG